MVKMKLWVPEESGFQMSDEAVQATPVYQRLREQLSIPVTGCEDHLESESEQEAAERMLLLEARFSITRLYWASTTSRYEKRHCSSC